MKVAFLADIHLKIGQKNVPIAWALDRYSSLFEQINGIECDELVIGGDIFDKTPNMQELNLYFNLVRSLKVPTKIFDGNHEATKKGQTFFSLLADASRAINPLVEVITEVTELPYGTILPYCKLRIGLGGIDPSKPLFTHVRGEIPPHVKPEIDLDLLNPWTVVFAGDLHSHSNTQRNIVYPGSPLTTTFHRNNVKTGYLLIDGCDWAWNEFELPQLIRKTVSDPDLMLATEYDHTIYELEGDIAELAKVKNTELLDKKLVKRSTESTLNLISTMTVKDELEAFLLSIMELKQDKVDKILQEFTAYDSI